MMHSVRLAGDLALVGVLVTVGSLPVLTAGAAIATGSAAIHHQLEHGRWPDAAELWLIFRRSLVRGLVVGPALLVAVALVAIDVVALRRGVVPGGAPALTVVLLAFSLAAGWAALAAVQAGAVLSAAVQPGPDFAAFRTSWRYSVTRPAAPVAAAAVLLVAVILAVLIHPVLTPVLAGFVLFALHVVARRLPSPLAPSPLADEGHKLGG